MRHLLCGNYIKKWHKIATSGYESSSPLESKLLIYILPWPGTCFFFIKINDFLHVHQCHFVFKQCTRRSNAIHKIQEKCMVCMSYIPILSISYNMYSVIWVYYLYKLFSQPSGMHWHTLRQSYFHIAYKIDVGATSPT